MSELVLPVETHDAIVAAAYERRGYTATEAEQAARFCQLASWHGIKTHNALKALHLDHLFGSGNATERGCVPGAEIEAIPCKFAACAKWNANRKLGQAVAFQAIEEAERLADKYGVGLVSVDNAFHYLWGGGYVMDSAKRGYIAYTNCTAALAEVVPFGGKFPTLGTNPHSWGFPTVDAVGFPVVIDWATSTVAMGRVQQLKREGKQLPPQAAVDADGEPTQDPDKVEALLPFGAHKGYGLSLINELVAAMIGGSLPTLRSRPGDKPRDCEKTTPSFFFQVVHPDALDAGARSPAAATGPPTSRRCSTTSWATATPRPTAARCSRARSSTTPPRGASGPAGCSSPRRRSKSSRNWATRRAWGLTLGRWHAWIKPRKHDDAKEERVFDAGAQAERAAKAVLDAAFEVHRALGPGYLESVYEKALSIELSRRGVPHVCQHPIRIEYKGAEVGEGRADLLVDRCLVVELKTVEQLAEIHHAQALSYLKALDLPLALLLNFKTAYLRDGIRRVIRSRS